MNESGQEVATGEQEESISCMNQSEHKKAQQLKYTDYYNIMKQDG